MTDPTSPTPVHVSVRVRPLNDAEREKPRSVRVVEDEAALLTSVKVEGGRKIDEQRWCFDAVHGEDDGQRDVFDAANVADLCNMAVKGYSATVMAYGQTGCGKTYTMLGPPGEFTGVIPTAAKYLYSVVDPDVTSIEASFLEIYNENVYDLLLCGSGSKEAIPLPVRYNPHTATFFVENAMVVRCDGHADLDEVVVEGAANRATSAHLLNADSSRSHAVLTLYLHTRHSTGAVTTGKINFVDLAGSERLKDSGSTGGTVTESCHINKSLLALGQVITSLSSNSQSYVPFRDSKLTKILMDSLGGRCRTAMIACVSPSSGCIDESVNTLKYAVRARCVVTTPAVRSASKDVNIKELQSRVNELQCENEALRAAVTPSPSPSSFCDDGEEVIARMKVEVERLKSENLTLKSNRYNNNGGSRGNVGVLQFARSKPLPVNNMVLQNFSAETTPASTPTFTTDSKEDPGIIKELKSVLAKVTMEADALSRGEPSRSVASIVSENIRLVEVLSHYDILNHTFDVRPKQQARQPPQNDSKYVQALEAQVEELQAEVEALSMSPDPDQRQHIIERRELRLQRETNAMLRLELEKLRGQ